MSKLNPISSKGITVGYTFWCPGCKDVHLIYTHPSMGIHWQFDGNLEEPTFSPSLLRYANKSSPRCHTFVRNGQIQFLGDCEHELKGQTVEIPEWRGYSNEDSSE